MESSHGRADTSRVRPALTFLGAVDTVTGNRFLLEHSGRRLLVDAGLYQGLAVHRRRNWEPFPIDPAGIDDVVLTHAHLDHTGYLPRLVKEGFRGRVTCTPETAELAAIVLRDSAHLQQEDARYANAAGFSKHSPALPLYDDGDVERALALFEPVELEQPVELSGAFTTALRPAGHILGSATVTIAGGGQRVAFSGDLGRPHHPLLRPPPDPPEADTLVVESTYGDRRHPPPDPTLLADAVRRTIARGGCVLVPAFAVDRTELVLLELRRLVDCGEIPDVPVYVDSPMALAALECYRRAAERGGVELRPEARELVRHFDSERVHAVHDVEGSMRLNRPRTPSIVISASGMATGGRVVHHLAHQLPDRRNCVVLTGYQADGTRGRQLAEGARQVKIHGRYVPVRAEVVVATDFSVHADAREMLDWLARAPRPPRTVYVVHGEPGSAESLARSIADELGWTAVVPRYGERVLVD
ncbi:MBL fold metallo-hydrolase [Nocardioides flavus (ex Wang et al. 2016)]|uniref:MBL fold metallo-hydrolase n=1 Tax=Nocardioides flavus (ex Wang et al. 2016) TaxID=2058780 RepID=A0ABQ3HQP3_9ACTN|nr:MBL fold metallo-hydrolase [Nocardioides flavus (ex Wang et al. 2016)]GHE19006.1 MBL fold metallo-hydrolase [Nocardioides flavus (ex Wang et al. 2016)]